MAPKPPYGIAIDTKGSFFYFIYIILLALFLPFYYLRALASKFVFVKAYLSVLINCKKLRASSRLTNYFFIYLQFL